MIPFVPPGSGHTWSAIRGGLVLCVAIVFCSCSGRPAARSQEPRRPDRKDDPAPPTNRLIHETSPYLLLHAHNPVDWYPWGSEALARAKREHKLIFLSVGYSSCHWCHVMERESFTDPEIADFLNKHFVCIKVDREERPDVDSIYMTAVQILTRRGGWPMSVFLTPDAKPFYGGSYFPARDGDRPGMPGFLTLIQKIHTVWQTERDKVEQDAERLTRYVKEELERDTAPSDAQLDADLLQRVEAALEQRFDERWGGFSFSPADPHQPKFPQPSNLVFLMDRIRDERLEDDQRQRARQMLTTTLDHMAMGGIRDHVGGGFHRYSVDRYWQIPHFEKMLYDNGQLASVYTEAYLLTHRETYRRVVVELVEFVLREMRDDGGGFYSSLDAESEDEEGKYYRWTRNEIKTVVTAEAFPLFAAAYGIDGQPNFEQTFFVPQLSKPFSQLAADRPLSEHQLAQRLDEARRKLLDARSKRVRPMTDSKILTSWNGLMIRGLADAGRGLDNPSYTQAAARAARFALGNLRTPDGRLHRTFGQGEARLNAYLDDYTFLVDGLLALYQATHEKAWLTEADHLTRQQIELFWDDRHGGFFFTSDDHESLLARAKNAVDSALPSGNSRSARNLVALSAALDRPDYRSKAERTIRSMVDLLRRLPSAVPELATATAELQRMKESPTNERDLNE